MGPTRIIAGISRRFFRFFAVMGVQDTITGFLLAGVGNVDARRKKNFLVVDSSK